jgi:hypothetical protein
MAFALNPQAVDSGAGWRLSVVAVPDPNCTLAAMHAGACEVCRAAAAGANECMPGEHTFLMDAVAPNGLHAPRKVAITLHVGALLVAGDVLARFEVVTEAGNASANARLERMLWESATKLTHFTIAAQASLASALQVHASSCGIPSWAGQPALGTDEGYGGVLLGVAQATALSSLQRESLDDGASVLTVCNLPCHLQRFAQTTVAIHSQQASLL